MPKFYRAQAAFRAGKALNLFMKGLRTWRRKVSRSWCHGRAYRGGRQTDGENYEGALSEIALTAVFLFSA